MSNIRVRTPMPNPQKLSFSQSHGSIWVCWRVDGDSENLLNPFMSVTNQMRKQVAALRDSEPLPAFTRACLSLITLTFRALGRSRNDFVSAPCGGIAMLCFESDNRIPLALSTSEMVLHCAGRPRCSPCSSILAMHESTIHHEALK